MTVLVAGGAGFVGANLIRRLLERGKRVIAVDDLSRGSLAWLSDFQGHERFAFIKADLSEPGFVKQVERLYDSSDRVDTVWHLAANSDIPAGVQDPLVDLRCTFLTTFHLLQYMRAAEVPKMMFASSSAVYGDFGEQEISENAGPLLPISNYGAMKLASEAQISAAAESFLAQGFVFRFPNVVGVPATHGVIVDFVRKLKANPGLLTVLGDGSQQKAYLHVSDLVDAMLFACDAFADQRVLLNVGPMDAGVTVKWIAQQVVNRVSPGAEICYGTGDRGWVGDVPKFRYSVAKLVGAGWKPKMASQAAVLRAIDEIAHQEGC